MPSHSLPETFAEELAKHEPANPGHWYCECGWRYERINEDAATRRDAHSGFRTHVAERLAACLVGVEHGEGGQLYRVGRCPDDSPVYAIREAETT